jgi:mannosidase alpha-like ER degradation enhancer 2
MVTLVDSLDTLAVMGNFSEFTRAVDMVQDQFRLDLDVNVSLFETNIRILGALEQAAEPKR